MPTYNDILDTLSTARSEFQSLEPSVYGRFVVPPFISSHNLSTISHSIALVGGRGCGKTTYLRYFSHWTQFDTSRSGLKADSLGVVILYWKPDTFYCRAMSQSWLSDQNARRFFHCYSGIEVLNELIAALENISHHFDEIKSCISNSSKLWDRFTIICNKSITSIHELKAWIADTSYRISSNLNSNNVSDLPSIDPKTILNHIIPALREEISLLANTKFKLFVDEFENLADYQQTIINTFRKGSDASLSWNVAYKKDAVITTYTIGPEQVHEPDDYRTVVLDDALSDSEYRFFASEIILLLLYNSGLKCEQSVFDASLLGDINSVEKRKDQQYRSYVSKTINRIFPTPSIAELSAYALSQISIRDRVSKRLHETGKFDSAFIQKMLDTDPSVAITSWITCKQESFNPYDVINYINNGGNNSFTQKIGTYQYAALLSINLQYSFSKIPTYAGFKRFAYISSGNIRHIIELCYQSVKRCDKDIDVIYIEKLPSLGLDKMHKGAIAASENIADEVSTFSPGGQTLSALVSRLGDLFQIVQRGVQSEPEQNHFYIDSSFAQLNDKISNIIQQAKCWRVLIEHSGTTKDKDPDRSTAYEYSLNPIYSPKYGITYRKKRRMTLSEDDFLTICFGDSSQFISLRNKFIKQYDDSYNKQHTLF